MNTRDVIDARASERFSPVRAGMQLWYLKTMLGRSVVPTPSDPAEYRTAGKAWRVLLVGNGAAHGWGVTTHDESLTGQLGDQFQKRSAHPVTIDYVGDELMNVQTVKNWLADVDLATYDLVVLLIGWNDAVRLTPLGIWENSLRELLADLRARKRPEAGLVAVGIEPMSAATGYKGLASRIGQRHADRLNAMLRGLVAGSQEAYTPLSRRRVQYGRAHESLVTYRAWAKDIALVASKLLPQGEPRETQARRHQFNWIGAEATLGHAGKSVPAVLRQIEADARRTFKVQIAQVTLINDGRQWFPNHDGAAPASAPLCLTYCDAASKAPDMLIVPNANKDPRFKGNPYLDQIHMPFYAGQALVARNGEVIGTFCILDAFPRPAWLLSRKKFKALAQRAQEALWAIEDIEQTRIAQTAKFVASLKLGQPTTRQAN